MNRDNLRRVAIWVDHREAIMVLFVGDHLDREKEILAGADSPVRDVNLPQYHLETHRHEVLKQYYDDVIQRLGPVDEILILGPGQAKHELRKRIEHHKGLKGKVVGLSTAPPLTEAQLVSKAEGFFKIHVLTHS